MTLHGPVRWIEGFGFKFLHHNMFDGSSAPAASTSLFLHVFLAVLITTLLSLIGCAGLYTLMKRRIISNIVVEKDKKDQ